MIIFILATVAFVALDQISKYIALTSLKPVGNMTFIKGFMDFTFVENRGAAFGILHGQRWFFVIMTIIITVAIFYYIIKKMPKTKEYKPVGLSLLLLLSGAWGNAIDRLIRGYVVDFFEFTFFQWPVFNMADIYVVVGTALLTVMLLFVIKEEKEGKTEESDKEKTVEENAEKQ